MLRTLIGDHADYGAFLLGPEWNHHSLLGKMFQLLRKHRHRWDVMHLLAGFIQAKDRLRGMTWLRLLIRRVKGAPK